MFKYILNITVNDEILIVNIINLLTSFIDDLQS